MIKEWELIKNIYGCTTILMQEEEAKETKNAFKVVEKSLKALEIIKNKQVDVCELKICIDEYEDSLYQYNKRTIEKFRLTKEEFNLLKEVLE